MPPSKQTGACHPTPPRARFPTSLPQAECRTLLTFFHLSLGWLAPVLISGVSEARCGAGGQQLPRAQACNSAAHTPAWLAATTEQCSKQLACVVPALLVQTLQPSLVTQAV